MAVAMFLRLRVPTRMYDNMLQNLEWDVSPPVGGILHVAAATEDGLEICEVWQTEAAADAFRNDHLLPMLRRLGATEPVDYAVFPLYNLYAADMDTVERIGSVSRPGVGAGTIFR